MCEANTYLLDEDGNEKLLLEPVDRVILSTDENMLESIFSEQKMAKAS